MLNSKCSPVSLSMCYVCFIAQPTIVENKTTKLVTSAVGLRYVISCYSFGNPPPEAVISKDGVEQIKSNGSLVEGMVVVTYTIDNATKENFGVHTCVSKNSQGSAEKIITVKEVGKFVDNKISPEMLSEICYLNMCLRNYLW